jgi:hypothetical protein
MSQLKLWYRKVRGAMERSNLACRGPNLPYASVHFADYCIEQRARMLHVSCSLAQCWRPLSVPIRNEQVVRVWRTGTTIEARAHASLKTSSNWTSWICGYVIPIKQIQFHSVRSRPLGEFSSYCFRCAASASRKIGQFAFFRSARSSSNTQTMQEGVDRLTPKHMRSAAALNRQSYHARDIHCTQRRQRARWSHQWREFNVDLGEVRNHLRTGL